MQQRAPHKLSRPPTAPPAHRLALPAVPQLPRTKDVACPACGHQEAVFFSQSSEVGMTLYFNCCACGHRWREQV
jgi:DNA-directed RNA polymerase subunit M/transcription elongation factor TFIIS